MIILCAYAPTDIGRSALRRAIDEAERRGGEVLVVNASRANEDTVRTPFTLTEVHDLSVMFSESDVEWSVNTNGADLTAAEEILEAAEDHDVDLIVLGVTGRRHVEKRIVSTVTRDVLLYADCAVLTVRADMGDPVVRRLAQTDVEVGARPVAQPA